MLFFLMVAAVAAHEEYLRRAEVDGADREWVLEAFDEHDRLYQEAWKAAFHPESCEDCGAPLEAGLCEDCWVQRKLGPGGGQDGCDCGSNHQLDCDYYTGEPDDGMDRFIGPIQETAEDLPY